MSVLVPPRLPSERRFGLMLTTAFAMVGIRGIIASWSWITYDLCFIASAVCGLLTHVIPQALAPLNKAWFYLGKCLGTIVSPIILGIIFFGILTPTSILTRLFGRDELRLKRRAVNSYWIDRNSLVVAAHSFRNQF